MKKAAGSGSAKKNANPQPCWKECESTDLLERMRIHSPAGKNANPQPCWKECEYTALLERMRIHSPAGKNATVYVQLLFKYRISGPETMDVPVASASTVIFKVLRREVQIVIAKLHLLSSLKRGVYYEDRCLLLTTNWSREAADLHQIGPN